MQNRILFLIVIILCWQSTAQAKIECEHFSDLHGWYDSSTYNSELLPIPFHPADDERIDDPDYQTRLYIAPNGLENCMPSDVVIEFNSFESSFINTCGIRGMKKRRKMKMKSTKTASQVTESCSYEEYSWADSLWCKKSYESRFIFNELGQLVKFESHGTNCFDQETHHTVELLPSL